MTLGLLVTFGIISMISAFDHITQQHENVLSMIWDDVQVTAIVTAAAIICRLYRL
jgi:malic enzyme